MTPNEQKTRFQGIAHGIELLTKSAMGFVMSVSEAIQCFDWTANDCWDFIYNFSNFFVLKLTDHKLIFVDCKSVAVLTGSPSTLLQPNLNCFLVLSSNYWFYDFDVTRFQKQF